MIKELALKNRSYRGFDEAYRFSREDMLEYVDIARVCPSSMNRQVLKFYIAYEQADLDRIFPLTSWAGQLPQEKLPREGKKPTGFIVICLDHEVMPNASTASFGYDVGIAAQTMLLAAAEKGLGGIMIGGFVRDDMKKDLELPENLEPVLTVAMGKPADDVRLVELPESGSTKYWRDENDVHYVPKRSLKELVINY